MVDSGIKCDKDSCDDIFKEVVKKGVFDYIIMDISTVKGKDMVVVKKTVKAGECEKIAQEKGLDTSKVPARWQIFTKDLEDNYDIAFGCCYVNFMTKDDRDVEKFVFVYWVGDDAQIKQKMVYSSTKMTVTKKIGSFHSILQCEGEDELKWSEIIDTVSKGDLKC